MDITPTIITTNASKSPETDTSDQHQTGASPIQSAKPLTFTNGVLKRHTQPQHRHHHHHHHHSIVVTYKECLKNHAASLGVHALDGCGEFMPSPTTNPSDPTSLKCSACGCHRNFHRREPDQDHLGHAHTPTTATIEYQPLHRHHPPPPLTQPNPHVPPSQRSPNSSSPPPISSSYYPPAPHALLALSGNLQQHSAAAANQEHGNINNNNNNNNNNNIMMMSSSGGRKRFRTKFSQIQKEKMFEFAERVGWKMQKRDEDLVHEICNQVGVDRTVLKVWMHNNKNTFAKRDLINGGGGIGKINLDGSSNNNNNSISISSKSGGDGDEDDQINGVNNNNNNGLQNLNHQFESTATTGNVANLANHANGGGGGGSSSSS